MKHFLLLLLVCAVAESFAQTRGKVIDNTTGEPIAGATVKGVETVKANAKGEFLVEATSELIVSSTGYETMRVKIKAGYLIVALQQNTASLSEVVVTAYNSKRQLLTVAAPVSVISKADINRGDNTTLIPILNAVPGVKLDYYTYGDYRLNIRGGALAQPSVHSSGYRMYWNDIPITLAGGGNPLGGLDPNFLSSIEIIKGPGSSMYGAGFGGTLLINTERGSTNETVINSDNMFGGYKTFRSSSGIRSGFSSGSIAFQYTHTESDGYRPMTNSNASVYNIFGQLYAGKKGTVSYLLNYEKRNAAIAGDLDSATFMDAPKTVGTIHPTGFGPDKITAGVGYQQLINNKWTAGVGAYYQDNKGEFVLSYPYFAIFDKEPSRGFNTRATISFKEKLGNTLFKLSVGIEWASNRSKGISYNGDFTTDTAVVTNINEALTKQLLGFAQAEFVFKSDVYFTLGASYNHYDYDVRSGTNTGMPVRYSATENRLVPRISVLKKFGIASAYVAVGEGFSPPAADIFNDFLNYDGSVNNNLKSSSGWNTEIGSRGTSRNRLFFYDVAFYRLLIKDAIISRLFEIQPGVNAERKTNAGKVKQTGIEAMAGISFATVTTSIMYGSQLRVGYTFNDYKYKDYKTFKTEYDDFFNPVYVPVDFSGKKIPGTIRNSWLLMLDLKSKPGIYLNYTLNTYSDTYLTNENTSKADAYTLMNVRIGFNKRIAGGKIGLHPYAGVNNLGNKLYSSLIAYNSTFGAFFNPGYRRQLYGGLQLNFYLN